MNLSHALAQASEVFEPKTFTAFREQLDPAWVMQALEDTGTVTVRRRRLPAEEMIWTVIGMALMRDRSIGAVANTLAIEPEYHVTESAAAQARQRLGKEPLEWLFAHSAKVWTHRSAATLRFKDLALYGLDGTTLRVPDSLINAKAFGYAHSVRGDSAYPMVRMVALMALRSHLIAAAAFGPYKDGEYTYAKNLWSELPDNSLCVVDRNFLSAKLLLQLQDKEKNRHWLVRCKTTTKTRIIKKLGPGDALVELEVSKTARAQDSSLPATFTARLIDYQRKGFRPQRLLTSMDDPKLYPASDIALLYHERWELELGYGEIKTQMLERREAIRSQTKDGVAQEIWGLLIAYNLVRLFMQRTADAVNLPPTRISFITALHFIREEWLLDSMPNFAAGKLPWLLQRLASRLARFVLPERRSERTYPRAVKIKMSNYPKKRRATKQA